MSSVRTFLKNSRI
ncbi:hypothetical protein QK083_000377 [Enterococcus faecalis]|nr:hypothetical protein [Enterococcus faecalis]EHL2460344.1 hypothetical protein [Enterococcus faecalis]EHM3048481.1 hypothetical protein [Enterococcus faecalis]EHQ2599038.1 hypothetical protein [Enterococcus faecalis]EHQ8819241.1 hypothetical protein [Enterococcus faecalis]